MRADDGRRLANSRTQPTQSVAGEKLGADFALRRAAMLQGGQRRLRRSGQRKHRQAGSRKLARELPRDGKSPASDARVDE